MIRQDWHWLSFNKIITLFYMKTDRFVITRAWHSFVIILNWLQSIFMFGNKLKNVLSNGDCWYIRNNRLNNSIIAITLWNNIRHEKCGGESCSLMILVAVIYSMPSCTWTRSIEVRSKWLDSTHTLIWSCLLLPTTGYITYVF